ncbi:cyclic pyranopterin monophosphate synthase MoaC [Zhenpiania hominis]|uniref:Cyclic pyranopterin monophosphate synthase n=1 Tax=Zhenpiania hominis TaxID=2763644 RepID=A0A923SW27_9FIRM|nr:cyclic pyranopterin monophosphate synthase MoaC [Zhenpiania hominis]MBC6679933.1 cyclic pyranopterin monophosphate synthase MoaC [Zhenpiania hominis]
MADFSHFNEDGRARMVDVGGKDVTKRTAVAVGRVLVNRECFDLIKSGGMKKGDVLGTAQIAGIMGAKKTSEVIPMCHPIMINGANITFHLNEEDLAVEIQSEVKCSGVTGVEMEALTAVSIAALTVYDMCKAVQKDMVIDQIHLVSKSGGKSGDFVWRERK